MRRIILVAMIVFGLAVIFLTFAKHTQHQLEVKTYFRRCSRAESRSAGAGGRS